MCEIKLLIVGDSERHNQEAIKSIEKLCLCENNGEVCLLCDQVGTSSTNNINIGDYDVVAIDDKVMSMNCGRALIGMDIPIIIFSDLINDATRISQEGTKMIASPAITHAIIRGGLRDKIASVTRDIQMTSRMLATI